MRRSLSTLVQLGAWRRFVTDERGATATEYGLMVALVSIAIVVAIDAVGQNISTVLYVQIAGTLSSMIK